jgi:hypothetical protein
MSPRTLQTALVLKKIRRKYFLTVQCSSCSVIGFAVIS